MQALDKAKDWIATEDELPPCDGLYYVTDHHPHPWFVKIATYNGYGFIFCNEPVEFSHWCHFQQKPKKYGKQKSVSSAQT